MVDILRDSVPGDIVLKADVSQFFTAASWIEGAATMTIAIAAIFILPDLPHNTRGFTEEERAVAVLRMTEDVGEADEDSAEESVFAGLIMAVKDAKIYVLMLTFTAYVVGLSFNAFL